MKLNDNLIEYNNIPESKPSGAAIIYGPIFDNQNKIWELKAGDEPSKLVNAIEIAWNGAEIQKDEKIKPINITSELLDWFQNMVNRKRFLNLLIEFIKSNSLEVIPTEDKLYLEIRKPYYWYVGDTIPTSLPNDDSNLATGTNSGWRKIGDSKPGIGTIIWNGNPSIIISTTEEVTQYIAINSDINIGSYDAFGNDQTSIALNDPTISNGMKIYTTTSRSKTFDQIIKIK